MTRTGWVAGAAFTVLIAVGFFFFVSHIPHSSFQDIADTEPVFTPDGEYVA